MAFKADKTVKALEYDFRPFLDVHGCTPEPSSEAVRHFLFETGKLAMKTAGEPQEDETEAEFIVRMQEITEDDFAEIAEQVLDLLGELTDGQPSREEIASLPHRIQRAYTQWLRKELTDPESPSADTRRSLKGLPSAGRSTSRAGS
jgi:hypothetical protein